MTRIQSRLILMTALTLTGCGGGSGYVGISPPNSQFVAWAGSGGDSQVIDGLSHLFAFYSDTGCLYNVQTGRENNAFCLAPGSNLVSYGAFRGQVVNVVTSNGVCQAAIIDSRTGNFSDIELDANGREVVLTTQLRPSLCSS